VAAYEGRLAAHNALEGDRIPVVFTTQRSPKMASPTGRWRPAADGTTSRPTICGAASNGRATGEDDDDGYLKLVFDADLARSAEPVHRAPPPRK
jgi:hypothetical protein